MANSQPSTRYGADNAQGASYKRREEMGVISDARKLLKHTYTKARNQQTFPKKDRRLADEMFSEALAVVTYLTEANEYRLDNPAERDQRLVAQKAALRSLRLLIANIELAHEILQGLDDGAFEFWAKLAVSVKNQAAAWYKSDTRRASQM